MADESTCRPLTRESVVAAHKVVAAHVHRTPVVRSRTLSELASRARTEAELAGTRWAGRRPARPRMRLWFKCENLQRVGAFKARGAFHAVARLVGEPGWLDGGGRERGVATHSSGNHAQALALAAREHGLPAHIVMPGGSLPGKMAAARGYGARVVVSGSTSEEREAVAARVVAETGARLVPPYDHPDIILGQGTVGLELQDQVAAAMAAGGGGGGGCSDSGGSGSGGGGSGGGGSGGSSAAPSAAPGLDAIIAPCGGGGLLAGIALSCEGTGIRVYGAEPSLDGADDARRGMLAGQRVRAVASRTVADGLRTPLGELPWRILHERRLVAGMHSVPDDDILAAMRLVLERCKMVVEPSACVGLAVALFDEDFRAAVEAAAGDAGWDLGVVPSGGNVDADGLGRLFGGAGGGKPEAS